MFSHFILHMSKFASFIIVYLVQIYIRLLESFLQITVLSFHVLCHKLLNNNSRLFGKNFLFVSHIILGVLVLQNQIALIYAIHIIIHFV